MATIFCTITQKAGGTIAGYGVCNKINMYLFQPEVELCSFFNSFLLKRGARTLMAITHQCGTYLLKAALQIVALVLLNALILVTNLLINAIRVVSQSRSHLQSIALALALLFKAVAASYISL